LAEAAAGAPLEVALSALNRSSINVLSALMTLAADGLLAPLAGAPLALLAGADTPAALLAAGVDAGALDGPDALEAVDAVDAGDAEAVVALEVAPAARPS
jgi:hypothetical protein